MYMLKRTLIVGRNVQLIIILEIIFATTPKRLTLIGFYFNWFTSLESIQFLYCYDILYNKLDRFIYFDLFKLSIYPFMDMSIASCIGTRIAICRVIDPPLFRIGRYIYTG